MTRAILVICLWSLCGLVGLYTAHLKAVNVETGQRLESKRKELQWSDEANGGIGIQIEEWSLKMEEGFGVGEEPDEL
ncbi:MAG: hypothetical protein MK297_05585 [Planctomycetes bacterium]|nr:hypothetical protein [Planctomycetota bacterium]